MIGTYHWNFSSDFINTLKKNMKSEWLFLSEHLVGSKIDKVFYIYFDKNAWGRDRLP